MTNLVVSSSHIHTSHFALQCCSFLCILKCVILGKTSLSDFVEYQKELNHLLTVQLVE